MKISTKGSYGLKAMVDLALYANDQKVTLKSISDRQNIPERYLEQIFSSLRKNNLITGRKGSQGGYVLAKTPQDITIGDILRTLEGELFVTDKNAIEDKMHACIKENVWDKLDKSINKLVDSITLEELKEDYMKKDTEKIMYYI